MDKNDYFILKMLFFNNFFGTNRLLILFKFQTNNPKICFKKSLKIVFKLSNN
jgi:hypothetical protein